MTVFLATNSVSSFVNPEGGMTLSTSDRDSALTDNNIYANRGILDFELPSPQNDLWIHVCAEMGSVANSGITIGGFNIGANRFDFYWRRSTGNWQALYMWNGSTYVEVGNRALFSEPQGFHYYDLHYAVHPTDGVIELYMDDTVLLRATGLDTSGFVTDSIQFVAMQSSVVKWSQFVIADEPTVCWRVMNRSVLNNTETIRVVGYNFQPIAGAVSGNTDVSLTSLIGGFASAPEPDDYVVAVFGTASTANRTLSITDGTANYTLVGNELYISDTFDLNLRVAIKKMGSTPDSFVRFGPTQSVDDAGVIGVLVLRGVDPTTFVDGSISNNQIGNTSQPDPASISITTLLSKILVVGGAAHDGTVDNFNNTNNFPFFIQFGSSGVNSVRVFVGLSYENTSTTNVNYAAITTNVNINTSSAGAVTFAVRPEKVDQTFSDTPNNTSLLTATTVRTAANLVGADSANQIVRANAPIHPLPSASYEVKGVGVVSRAIPGETGPQSANCLVRTGKTDYHGPDHTFPEEGSPIQYLWELNPDTGLPWTFEEASSALVGIRSRT